MCSYQLIQAGRFGSNCYACLIVYMCPSQVIQAGMFNQNSTSSQRRQFLMALLDTENDYDEVSVFSLLSSVLCQCFLFSYFFFLFSYIYFFSRMRPNLEQNLAQNMKLKLKSPFISLFEMGSLYVRDRAQC